MRRHPALAVIVVAFAAGSASAQAQYPFQDPSLDLEQLIDNVLRS
jgi:hypothetical protein